jgi:hypothetical protein
MARNCLASISELSRFLANGQASQPTSLGLHASHSSRRFYPILLLSSFSSGSLLFRIVDEDTARPVGEVYQDGASPSRLSPSPIVRHNHPTRGGSSISGMVFGAHRNPV